MPVAESVTLLLINVQMSLDADLQSVALCDDWYALLFATVSHGTKGTNK